MDIDINPTNPLNVAGFSHNLFNRGLASVFYSTDGGTNWNDTIIGPPSLVPAFITDRSTIFDDGLGTGKRFDPSIAFDALGNLFITYAVDVSASDFNNPHRLVVGWSGDGGKSFQFRVADSGDIDRMTLATGVDPSSGKQTVYIAYSKRFGLNQRVVVLGFRLFDTTFTGPVTINDDSISGNGCGLGASPAVGPNGELYVAWHKYCNGAKTLMVDRDLDGLWAGGSSFGTDVTVRTLERSGSTLVIPAQPNRGVPFGPSIDVDRSAGSHRGRVYIAFMDLYPGTTADTDVYLTSSDDRGASWTSLGTDANVDNAIDSSEFLPAVAVDQSAGSVHVIYYSSDGFQSVGNDKVNVWLASSIDGGATFGYGKLTAATSKASEATQSGGVDFLEYIGLAARDGVAHGLWAANRAKTRGVESYSTNFRAWTARSYLRGVVTIQGDPGDDQIEVRMDPADPTHRYLQVLVNGSILFDGRSNSVQSMIIAPGLGQNVIRIADVPSVTQIFVTSEGDDRVQVGSNGTMETIAGRVTISHSSPSPHTSIIELLDTQNSNSHSLAAVGVTTFGQGVISGLGPGLVDFTSPNIKLLSILGGSGRDTWTVFDTPASVITQINTGRNNDTVNVLGTNGPLILEGQADSDTYVVNLGDLLGSVTIDDGGPFGSDMLAVKGTSDPDYIVKMATQVSWGNPASETIKYAGVEQVTVEGGSGADTIIDPDSADVTILAGPDNDTIILSDTRGNGVVADGENDSDRYVVTFGNLLGPVSIADSGTTGADSGEINGAPGNNVIVATDSKVTSGLQTVKLLSPLANLTIRGGSGDNQITVADLAADLVQNLTLIGGGGNNLFTLVNVGSSVPSLTVIGAGSSNDVTVQGPLPAQVTMQNVAPLVSAGIDGAADEGSVFARSGFFIDTDASQSYTGAVDYGDGAGAQPLSLNADHTFSLSHVYSDNGIYAVTVAVADGRDGTGRGKFSVTVNNVPPTLADIGSQTADQGRLFSPMFNLTDPGFRNPALGTDETFTYSINWGDATLSDSGSAMVDVIGSPGILTAASFTGMHRYAVSGTFTVKVDISDDDGGTDTKSFTVKVNPSIFVIDPIACAALDLSGSASIDILGSVVLNSLCPDKALVARGDAHLGASAILVRGGVHTNGNPTLTPNPIAGLNPLPDPPDPLGGLASPLGGAPFMGSVDCNGGLKPLSPGVYSGIKATGNCSLSLQPGAYFVAGGGIDISGNASAIGSGVFIYNAGSNFPGPGGEFGGISLSSSGNLELTPPPIGDTSGFGGVLIFQARDNAKDVFLSGGFQSVLEGTIYAPAARLIMSGNSQLLKASYIVGTLSATGNEANHLNANPAGAPAESHATDMVSQLANGLFFVSIDRTESGLTADQEARVWSAIAVLNNGLADRGITLIADRNNDTWADIRIRLAGSSICGSADEGVLGCETGSGEITIINGWEWYTGPESRFIHWNQYDFQTVVTHELGHSIGLDHSLDPASVMFGTLAAGVSRRTLRAADFGASGADVESDRTMLGTRHSDVQMIFDTVTAYALAINNDRSGMSTAATFNDLLGEPIAVHRVAFPLHAGSELPQRNGRNSLIMRGRLIGTAGNKGATPEFECLVVDAIMAEWISTDFSDALTGPEIRATAS